MLFETVLLGIREDTVAELARLLRLERRIFQGGKLPSDANHRWDACRHMKVGSPSFYHLFQEIVKARQIEFLSIENRMKPYIVAPGRNRLGSVSPRDSTREPCRPDRSAFTATLAAAG